jgi:curved DNA-binding protein
VKDPYGILGVSRSASADEIRRAYRKLAKEFHPDRNAGNKAAEARFKEVQAAYEVLGDAERRKQYDQFGSGGPAPRYEQWASAGGGRGGAGVHVDLGGMGDLSDIFQQFFQRGRSGSNGRRSSRRPEPEERGSDLEHVVHLSFEEAARGATREVLLRGSGADERIEVRIPAGIDDGQIVRVRGRGNEGAGARGDLLIRCRIQPHAYFRREGRDVILDLPVSVAEAGLGARVDIPTLDGPMRLTVPAGTSSGAKLRLRGKGIKDPRGGEPGDMYAIVSVHLPQKLSPRLTKTLEETPDDWNIEARRQRGWEP